MFREVEQYTNQFIVDSDQSKANLAMALTGMLRMWINLYGDLPTLQAEKEVEKVHEIVLSRGLVIQEVESLPILKPRQRTENFLQRVSRSGHIVTVDANGNNPAIIVDLGTIRYFTLKARGYNIHFYEDLPITLGESDSGMALAVAGDSVTKEKEAAIWRYEKKHPILGGLNNMVHISTYEAIESQYQAGLDQIIGAHSELKP